MGKPKIPPRARGRNAKGLLPMTENMENILRDDRRPSKMSYEPMSNAQARYDSAIEGHTLTFGVGPAGTGKTYVATAKAALGLLERRWSKLIITRPAVEAGEQLGFLPGELGEKFDPYFAPVKDILNKIIGKGAVEAMMRSERIVALPLAFMRGHTFEDAFVLLDEAQNTTPTQMKMFLTRIGEGCKVVVDGDTQQIDIKGPSGLLDALDRVTRLSDVSVVRFGREDIVRSGLVQAIVESYQTSTDE